MSDTLPAVPDKSGPLARRSVDLDAIRAAADAKTPPTKYVSTIPQDDWEAMPAEERFEILKWYVEREMETPEGVTITFPEIKFPTSQTPFFQIPAGGEIKTTKTFAATIVYKVRGRGVWLPLGSAPVKGTLPTCSSIGGLVPMPPITDEARSLGAPFSRSCLDCKFNAWGSAPPAPNGKPRRGKACRERCNCFLIFDDYELPFKFSIPPSSLKGFGKYVSDIESARIPGGISGIDTKFSLIPAKSDEGIEYFQLGSEMESKLTFQQARRAKKLHDMFRDEMERRGMIIEADETDTTEDPATEFDPAKF